MNQSILHIGEFEQVPNADIQIVDIQGFHFENLFHIASQSKEARYYWLRTGQPKQALRQIMKTVKVLRAAGGMVQNPEGAYLFIFRLGKWDLPKGKAEAGELPGETALREVQEECGIEARLMHPDPLTTYHAYIMKGKLIIKPTDWFFMHTQALTPLIPQLEEDITQARWIMPAAWGEVLQNTYPLIQELLSIIQSDGDKIK